MTKIIKFGEEVEGYDIPVLNEREINKENDRVLRFTNAPTGSGDQ